MLKLLIIINVIKCKFNYKSDTVRGVNFGGWFVTEPWITPSIYEPYEKLGVKDEYTLCQKLGKVKCKEILKKHWDTWVTEEDFRKVKEYGLTHVRVPIGYWAFIETELPYVQGQLSVLRRSIGWAKKYGIQILLDLHGAPGSQNGFDNSGQLMKQQTWTVRKSNIQNTIEILKRMTELYKGDGDVISSLAVLNEPHGGQIPLNIIGEFYWNSHSEIRKINPDLQLWFGDAFYPQNWTHIKEPDFQKVGLDSHFYYVFDYGMLNSKFSEIKNAICNGRKNELSQSQNGQTYQIPHIVGEWSAALTDCAKWLNGVSKGSRYEGTFEVSQLSQSPKKQCISEEDSKTWSEEKKKMIRMYSELQMSSYEKYGGWIFWNFKTETADAWNYFKGVEQGYISKDPRQLTYRC